MGNGYSRKLLDSRSNQPRRILAPHNSGERDLVVMQDLVGADTGYFRAETRFTARTIASERARETSIPRAHTATVWRDRPK